MTAFEKELCTVVGAENVVALESGTSAIHLALILCGVRQNDEVIVQSMTFCALTNPIAYLGATPVSVDSEKDSWNMNPELLEEMIKDRNAPTYTNGVSESLFKVGICLPVGHCVTDDDIRYIIDTIKASIVE